MWSLCQSLDNDSPMRVHVYYYLVQLAGKLNQIDLVYKDMESLRSNFSANPPSNEQMQKLFRLLHEVLLSNGRSEDASQVLRWLNPSFLFRTLRKYSRILKLKAKFLKAITHPKKNRKKPNYSEKF